MCFLQICGVNIFVKIKYDVFKKLFRTYCLYYNVVICAGSTSLTWTRNDKIDEFFLQSFASKTTFGTKF